MGEPNSAVATATRASAHRRDHRHDDAATMCHPHLVEVVHLGGLALAICHDCNDDTGFVSRSEAERAAAAHRQATAGHDVPLQRPPSD